MSTQTWIIPKPLGFITRHHLDAGRPTDPQSAGATPVNTDINHSQVFEFSCQSSPECWASRVDAGRPTDWQSAGAARVQDEGWLLLQSAQGPAALPPLHGVSTGGQPFQPAPHHCLPCLSPQCCQTITPRKQRQWARQGAPQLTNGSCSPDLYRVPPMGVSHSSQPHTIACLSAPTVLSDDHPKER